MTYTTSSWVQWTLSQYKQASWHELASSIPETFGSLQLASFQRHAVGRILSLLAEFHGALLADAVGLGKTRVGLVAACLFRNQSPQPIVACVPARLIPQWEATIENAGLNLDSDVLLYTHSQLSHMSFEDALHLSSSVVLVDEAHKFKNPNAKRSKILASLTSHSPVILMSATPVINDARELYHLLRLFLGEHDLRHYIGMTLDEAFDRAQNASFDLTELLEIITIRRERAPDEPNFGQRPKTILHTLSFDTLPSESWMWQHLADSLSRISFSIWHGDWPRALIQEFLSRRWESGPHALEESLASICLYHQRWLEQANLGRRLEPSTCRTFFQHGSVQEVLPFILDSWTQHSSAPSKTEIQTISEDLQILQRLMQHNQLVLSEGSGRDASILELLREHDSEKFLIFSSYQDTANALYSRICQELGPDARVGLVTGRQSVATGIGPCQPFDVLRRFAPIAQTGAPLPPHQEIRILVATDCLSAGLNLQDCGRIILADLPYTPLEIEQRIGRLVRPGSTHPHVDVYLPRPKQWQHSLGMRRVDAKLQLAQSLGLQFGSAHSLSSRPPQNENSLIFEASTSLDMLSSHLDSLTPPTLLSSFPSPSWWQAHHHGPRTAWIFSSIDFESSRRFVWARILPQSNSLETRIPQLIRPLVQLADLDLQLSSSPPFAELQTLKPFLDDRIELWTASLLTPMNPSPVTLSWWGWLTSDEVVETLDLDPESLLAWRYVLWCSRPRGVEARLLHLWTRRKAFTIRELSSQLESLLLLRMVRSLPSLQILGGVLLLPHNAHE